MNSLKNLSDVQLENDLKSLIHQERKLLHLILLHVKEVDSRKLYLRRAYSSLYEYMTQALGYSGSAAMRRIEAARLLNEVPALAEKIQSGAVNLTQVGELARAIKEKEKVQTEKVPAEVKNELLLKIESTSAQTTQKILAQELSLEIKDFERRRIQRDESVRAEITFTKQQMEKIERCQDLLSHTILKEYGATGLADVIEAMADQIIKLKTVKSSKTQKTYEREANRAQIFEVTTAAVPQSNKTLKSVTPRLRREVLHRDQCCQYKDPQTGRICGATFALQADHMKPKWAGGENSHQNLQVLCGNHNRMKYLNESHVRLLSYDRLYSK